MKGIYIQRERTNKKAIIRENIPGRGDHDCKCPETESFPACWSKNNDNRVGGGKGVRWMLEDEEQVTKGTRVPVKTLAFILSDIGIHQRDLI